LRYVLSDLDGVLVDSGAAVERVWREWAIANGLDPDLVARESHGVPAHGVLARIARHLNTPEEIDRIERLHEAAGLPAPRVLITSDLTERGKPYPDPYLAGAAALAPILPSAW
jgi:beta-phosphoglucomutase-like phosphatase (HAD superfamily)